MVVNLKRFFPFLALFLGACSANLYGSMPQAYFHKGPGDLTVSDVRAQDAANVRCEKVAQQTTPSDGKASLYYGTRYAAGGLVGGGAGYAAAASVVGMAVAPAAVIASGLSYGIASGAVGAVTGPINNDILRRNTKVWCRALGAYGVEMYPPSAAKKIRKQKRSVIMPTREKSIGAQRPLPPIY